MPVHDWTRVVSGVFHDFHQTWITTIKNALNDGLLPEGFYAMVEQIAEGPRPDVIALEAEDVWESASAAVGQTALAIEEHPPRVQYSEETEEEIYAQAADRVAVRHSSGDRVVAYIELVSPGNKHSEHDIDEFIEKLDEALERGCHLLIIDILPPGKHDPRGMHARFWEHRTGHAHGVDAERPLGLSAYQAKPVGEYAIVPRAWFQPVAVGQTLPDMPLFLTANHYINCPLESTYMAAWQGVPKRWKVVLEGENSDRSTPDH